MTRLTSQKEREFVRSQADNEVLAYWYERGVVRAMKPDSSEEREKCRELWVEMSQPPAEGCMK